MVKGSEVRGLHADAGTRGAAIEIMWTRFEDMWAQHGAVLKDFDADAVHDMRVASRRLRTAMQTFRPCFARKPFKRHSDHIRSVADSLGEVRDRDVLLEELKTDLEALPEDERAGVKGLVDELKFQRKLHREVLRLLLEEMQRTAYDRDFLSYLARNR